MRILEPHLIALQPVTYEIIARFEYLCLEDAAMFYYLFATEREIHASENAPP